MTNEWMIQVGERIVVLSNERINSVTEEWRRGIIRLVWTVGHPSEISIESEPREEV